MSEVQTEISKLLEPLWIKHAELTAKRDEIAGELGAVNDELRQVERVLKAGEPDKFAPSGGENGARQTGETKANAERILRIMWAEPAIAFTFDVLADKTGLSVNSVKTAVQSLRASGDVRHVGRMPKKPGAMGAAPVGFKVAEGAHAPDGVTVEPIESGRSKARANVAGKHVDAIYQHLLTEPDREWLRRDTYDLLGIHEATVNFAWRVMEDEGMVVALQAPRGGHPGIYKVVTHGSEE